MMEKLNLPAYSFKMIRESKKTKIFDAIRRKFIVLTPEEWVRQNFIQYLIQDKDYPSGLLSVEKGLEINQLKKRTDILIYSRTGKPIAIVECKSTKIPIGQAAFDQIARYNLKFNVPYLIVTNGINHYCAILNFEDKSYQFLKDLPNYEQINEKC